MPAPSPSTIRKSVVALFGIVAGVAAVFQFTAATPHPFLSTVFIVVMLLAAGLLLTPFIGAAPTDLRGWLTTAGGVVAVLALIGLSLPLGLWNFGPEVGSSALVGTASRSSFDTTGVHISPIKSLPRCHANILGVAPVNTAVWIAHASVGSSQYYLDQVAKRDFNSIEWSAHITLGADTPASPDGSLPKFDLVAFTADDAGTKFLQSRGAAIHGAETGLVFFGALPPGVSDVDGTVVERQVDLSKAC